MQDANKLTIKSYESGVKEYLRQAPAKSVPAIEEWVERSLRALDVRAKILELGSGDGRDARLIESKGYRVEKTDAAKGFVRHLQKQDPSARILNIVTDEITGTYDLIIADAVLLHLTDDEMELALAKIYRALNPGGIFSLTLKKGTGSVWQNNKGILPRFFNLWSQQEINNLLTKVGFASIDIAVDIDQAGREWLMIVAKRAK